MAFLLLHNYTDFINSFSPKVILYLNIPENNGQYYERSLIFSRIFSLFKSFAGKLLKK